MRTWMAVAIGMVATPAMAADRFDLVCKGKGFESRYRVDLTRNEACEGPCNRVWKMGEASSGQLKLIDKAPVLPGDLEERATVNRVTGEYNYMNRLSTLRPTYRDGKCEQASFSGFPVTLF